MCLCGSDVFCKEWKFKVAENRNTERTWEAPEEFFLLVPLKISGVVLVFVHSHDSSPVVWIRSCQFLVSKGEIWKPL